MNPHDRNPLIDDLLAELRRAGPFASMDELNRRAAALMGEYNSRPQTELGGLSPDQVSQLLSGDWYTSGALRLNQSLTLDELQDAAALHDARTILDYVANEGPIKLTTIGNLPRKAVAALRPKLRTEAIYNDPPERPRVINEDEVLWLSILRHVLMFAGLLVRRKGLIASRQGKATLAEQEAGRLYSQLFFHFFRTLDLRVFWRDDRHAGLQSTIAYSFYKLRTEAREWSRPEVPAETAWLPDAKDPPSESDLKYGDLRHHAFTSRVLIPLVQFGLMERRTRPSDKRWPEYEYRLTPLFDRFIRFDLGRRR